MSGSDADRARASTVLFDLHGRSALVTGSSRGIGFALATALADAGADVTLHGRDVVTVQAAAERLQELSGRRPGTLAFDVTDPGAVEKAVQRLTERSGTPDVLVNNAGLQRRAPIDRFAVGDWDDLIATNLSGPFYVSRFVAPGMRARRSGKIINIASVQSVLARATIAPYSASKGGLVQLTRGMAADMAGDNVQVNAISPGYFATEMNRALVADDAFDKWVRTRTPAGRWGRVEELAGALIFLASAASDFVSGQNIFVDGGMTAVV